MIHHTTNSDGGVTMESIIRMYLRNHQFGAPYDIIIDKSGRIGLMARWIFAGSGGQFVLDATLGDVVVYDKHHLSIAGDTYEQNKNMVHIALIGDFDVERPTPIQVARLQDCITRLKEGIPSIVDAVYHSDQAMSSCPGRLFVSKTELGIGDQSIAETTDIEYEPLTPNSSTYNLEDVDTAVVPRTPRLTNVSASQGQTTRRLSAVETPQGRAPKSVVEIPATISRAVVRNTPQEQKSITTTPKKTFPDAIQVVAVPKRLVSQEIREGVVPKRVTPVDNKVIQTVRRVTAQEEKAVTTVPKKLFPDQERPAQVFRRSTPQEIKNTTSHARLSDPGDFEERKKKVLVLRRFSETDAAIGREPIKFHDPVSETINFSSENVYFNNVNVFFNRT